MANHVSHAALPYPIKGCRFTLAVPYLDADGDPTDPTTPDTEVSKDAAAFADCTEEVTTITGSNGAGYITLTGDETNCSLLVVCAKVASGPKATLGTLYPRVLPIIYSGTAAAGAAGTITLDSNGPTNDDILKGAIVRTTGGTGGAGGSGSLGNQARAITAYVGSTKVATVSPSWETTPDNTTTYEVLMTEGCIYRLVDVRGWNGSAVATPATAGVPDVNAKNAGNVAWGSGAITAASVATGAFDADALATDAVTEINADVLAAIGGIGTASGAAINVDATTDNSAGGISGVTSATTKVGTQTGTYTNTSNVNSTYHQITHAANLFDWVYQFLTGGGTSPVSATWTGYLDNGSDTVTFYAWNHVGAAWESIGTQLGQAGTTNVIKNMTLYARHRGTSAAELGKVYIRLAGGTSTPVLYTDQLYVSYSVTSRTAGYADGAVWVRTSGGTAGTESYVNGTADNPVLSIADAYTIATAVGLTRFRIVNGSTITLAASAANKSFVGFNWTMALGGQAIDSMYVSGAEVSGTGTNTTQAHFVDCHINDSTTTGPAFMQHCGLDCATGTPFTAGSAGEFLFTDCFSEFSEVSAGGATTPFLEFPGACTIQFRRYSGGADITLNNTSASLTCEVVGGGGLTVAIAGADMEVRGMPRSITVTGIASTSSVQINCVTGPISLAGADGTVNVYGVSGTVTDSRTGTPLGTVATVLNKVNLATPTNITAGTITTVSGNVTGTIGGLTAAALKDFFDTDTTTTFASAVAGSVVKEIADNAGGATVNPFLLASGTIGSTGNDTTHLHLTGQPFGDDEINDCLIVVYDVSATEYHARWVSDWADTGDLATVATLPFTPQDATDTYKILAVRRDITGGSGLDAAATRAALGLASANLDTQLSAIDDFLDTEVAAILAAVDTEVAAIKAKTDNLPSDPADASDIADSFTTVNTKLDTIDDFLDTEIAAIKAKTDNLPSDPADNSDILAAITAASAIFYELEWDSAFTTTAGTTWRAIVCMKYGGVRSNVFSTDATATCALAVREHGSGSDLFTISATTVNANGTFELSKTTPGFTADRVYRFTFTVVISAVTYTFEVATPVQG